MRCNLSLKKFHQIFDCQGPKFKLFFVVKEEISLA